MNISRLGLAFLASLLLVFSCSKEGKFFLTIAVTEKTVDWDEGSTTIEVASNVGWVASCDQSWCTVVSTGSGNGMILVDYTENKGITERTAQIKVAGAGVKERVITLKQGVSPIMVGMMAYYPFNGNAEDESGNGRDGQVHGAVPDEDRNGTSNAAYFFNGGSSYIDLPDSIWSNEMSLSVWINVEDFGSSNPNLAGKLILFKSPDTGYSRDFTFGVHNMNSQPRCNFIFGNSSSEFFNLESSSVLSLNSWYNLVITRKNGVVKMYVNGVQDATANYSFVPVHHYYDLKVGTSHITTQTFKGVIDDVRVYNRALSDSEVLLLFDY